MQPRRKKQDLDVQKTTCCDSESKPKKEKKIGKRGACHSGKGSGVDGCERHGGRAQPSRRREKACETQGGAARRDEALRSVSEDENVVVQMTKTGDGMSQREVDERSGDSRNRMGPWRRRGVARGVVVVRVCGGAKLRGRVCRGATGQTVVVLLLLFLR